MTKTMKEGLERELEDLLSIPHQPRMVKQRSGVFAVLTLRRATLVTSTLGIREEVMLPLESSRLLSLLDLKFE